METKPATNNELCYEDFEPFCQWKEKEGFKVLEVHLPGLRRQDVRVQINNLGILTISGKQSTDESITTTPSRFRKEIEVSKKCNANDIRAKFSRGILSITIPSTQLPEYSKDSVGSGSGEKITRSSINHYLISLRSKVVRPKLNKKIALTMAVVALVVALGGYIIYRFAK